MALIALPTGNQVNVITWAADPQLTLELASPGRDC